jgi:hypothetical protein
MDMEPSDMEDQLPIIVIALNHHHKVSEMINLKIGTVYFVS